MIINITGCLKPCQVKEYSLATPIEIEHTVGKPIFRFEFAVTDFILKREVESYGLLSLFADIGGSLGMLLGFSLLNCLDVTKTVLMSIKSYIDHKL